MNEQMIVDLFLRLCQRDTDLTDVIRKHGLDIEMEREDIGFTLQAVWSLHCHVFEETAPDDLSGFQQALFKAPVNARLAEIGYQVVHRKNTGKISSSRYAIIRRSN